MQADTPSAIMLPLVAPFLDLDRILVYSSLLYLLNALILLPGGKMPANGRRAAAIEQRR
jgi:hypothetical protein